MRVLFVGCHCDDIELGCGGTIHKYAGEWDIGCVTLSQHIIRTNIPLLGMSANALAGLGVKEDNLQYHDFPPTNMAAYRQEIWDVLHQFHPDLVFTHEPDTHQDHVVAFEATVRAFPLGTGIITYRASTHSCPVFNANLYVEITEANVQAKQAAVRRYDPVYKNKHYMTNAAVGSQAVVDGLPIGAALAEAFRVHRMTTRVQF